MDISYHIEKDDQSLNVSARCLTVADEPASEQYECPSQTVQRQGPISACTYGCLSRPSAFAKVLSK